MSKHELETVVWGIIPLYNYNGVLVTKTSNGYTIFGREVRTPKEVDDEIDKARLSLSKSLTIENRNDNFTVSNTKEV